MSSASRHVMLSHICFRRAGILLILISSNIMTINISLFCWNMCILAISNSYWPQSLFRNELEITKMIFLLLLITAINLLVKSLNK
jgi:hypothetical protein